MVRRYLLQDNTFFNIMKATTILKRLAALSAAKKVSKNSQSYKLIVKCCNTGNAIIRPCWTSGSGRYTSNLDYTDDTRRLLDMIRVKYTIGNDAPRGGLTGNWIKIQNLEK